MGVAFWRARASGHWALLFFIGAYSWAGRWEADLNSYLVAAIPIFNLAANVLCQILVYRLSKRFYQSIGIGFFFGLIATMMVVFRTNAALSASAVQILSYSFLSFGYFAFLNLGETSIRLRLLQEL